MFKRLIKAALKSRGYRIVPEELDARSFRKILLAQNFGVVVDVGAASGSTVRQWLKDFPSAHVHAVEPLPASYASLQSIAKGFPGRVTAWNCAAGSEDESALINFHEDHATSSSLLERTEYCANAMPDTRKQCSILVDVRRLDSLLIDGKPPLRGPILLKLDVQGFEDRVLEGARELLKQTQFVLSEISIAPVYAGQCDFAKLHSLMTTKGFAFSGFLEQFHLGDGTPVYADVVYRKEDASRQCPQRRVSLAEDRAIVGSLCQTRGRR